MELNYLHPRYFTPDESIFKLLGISRKQKFVVLRFVAWSGHHDLGHHGLTESLKKEVVKILSKKYKVFISSEAQLPKHFEDLKLSIPPYKMHDVLAYASLFIGESGTMAGECAVLGTPSIYVNSLPLMGYLREAKDNGLLFHLANEDEIINKIEQLMMLDDIKNSFKSNHLKHVRDKIDGTAFLVWFLENYPKSIRILREKPSFQNSFL